jgi:nitroreductase
MDAARPGMAGMVDTGSPTPAELAAMDSLLVTTRSIRRHFDLTRPVPPAVIETCLNLALQAPTSHNLQNWHWVVVTDPDKRARVASAYVRSCQDLTKGRRPGARTRRWQGAGQPPPRHAESVDWLGEHLAEVPVHIIPCLIGRPPSGATEGLEHIAAYWASIYPAVWSFQLALRSRGLGSVLTCFHLRRAAEVAAILGLPPVVTQTCLLPVAYTTRTLFRPAARVPLDRRISWNHWMGTR